LNDAIVIASMTPQWSSLSAVILDGGWAKHELLL